MSERVTMQRLEELIAADNKMFCSPTHATGPELLACLLELQSLRTASVAGVEEAVLRIAESVTGITHACYHPTVKQQAVKLISPVIAAELTALLAERDAVIRECRVIVQDRHDAWVVVNNTFPTERAQRDRDYEVQRCVELLARIDAILGKEGEGGK